MSSNVAGVQIALSFDRRSRIATVNGRDVTLAGTNNVLLFDKVDAPGGAQLAGQALVRPDMTEHNLGKVMGTSPKVVEFLRCDAVLANPGQQTYVAKICSQLVVK